MSAQSQIESSPQIYTEAQYGAMEESALEKHEFVGGKIYQRARSSFNHTAICGNVLETAHSRRRGKNYRVFKGDMKVKVQPPATASTSTRRFIARPPNLLARAITHY